MAESNQNGDMLVELKAAVLNIDWEISDNTLEELERAVNALQVQWAGQKVLLIYLQIIGALCQYVGLNREKSHPGTFLLLKEAFGGLESVICDPDISQDEKNDNVMAYAERYNSLKKEIAAGDFIPGPAKGENEEKATMDVLMDDEGQATDTVFDSMLNAMVQPSEDESEVTVEDEGEDDTSESSPPPPPVRPAVQAPFDKADGTEVEPDRNAGDEFAEADELLDDFFDDDDIPAPGETSSSDTEKVFDLNELREEESEELTLEQEDESTDDSFQEMEDALDDFFGDDEDQDLLDPVDDDALIDDALDDFFGDEDDQPVAADNESEQVVVSTDGVEDELVFDEDNDDSTSDMVSPALGAADEESSPDDLTPELILDEVEPVEELVLEEVSDDSSAGDAETDLELVLDEEPDVSPSELVPEMAIDEPDNELELTSEQGVSLGGESDDESALPVDVADLPVEEGDTDVTSSDLLLAEKGDDAGLNDVDSIAPESTKSCVENLQMLLLSVEWEVDDKLLTRLEEEVDSLTLLLKDNGNAAIHLSFLGTVIRYIVREQAGVISDSMTCLKLIADSLDALVADQASGSDSSKYGQAAVCSFVDWHDLVVLDFEKQLLKNRDIAEGGDAAIAETVVDSEVSVLSPEMKEMRAGILKEVRELIALEIAESKK